MAIDRQKLRKEHICAGRGTAAELMADLATIRTRENHLKRWARLIRWVALAVFLAFAAAAVIVNDDFIFGAVFAPVILLAGAAFVAPPAVSHDRVEFLRLVLNMLNQDAGQRGRFEVLLRLRSKPEKASQGPNPRAPGGTQTFLRDSWLSLAGSLSDGTSISESCIDLIRWRTKKNPRGKQKRKERRICLLRVQLDYNSGKYGDAAVAARVLENPFRLPDGAEVKAFSSTDKALAIKMALKGTPTPASLHAANQAMLLGAYRILNLARRRALATGGAR